MKPRDKTDMSMLRGKGKITIWRRYEAQKTSLRNLTPAEYEKAVQKLAKRIGA